MAGGSRASTLVAIHRGGEKRSRLRMSESHGQALHADIVESSSLYNKDLAPVRSERRLWRTYNYAALWISMSVNIPTYMLASGMIAGGMSWKQALFTVFLGNVLVLIPCCSTRTPARNTASRFPFLPALLSVHSARIFPRFSELWSLAAGLAFKPGLAAKPSTP